ncbi:Tad domain-containing protein [Agromyces sp. ZXT2-6]|uniref:Tad domain-containing protein n=1 Tax=Agromyces sp. ZXT2-6 TaxID=3461153 RepID=UPI0040552C44
MRRLIRRFRRAERGASAVLVGLLIVPLIGAAAIAVDVGAMYAERAAQQNGADGAALAIASACAKDEAGCGAGAQAMASEFVLQNAMISEPSALTPQIDFDAHLVTVATENTVSHPLAAVLTGTASSTVQAVSSAEWGSPNAGIVLPLALSLCEFQDPDSGVRVLIEYHQTSENDCTRDDGQPIEGGFGWLDLEGGACETYIDLDSGYVGSDPGIDPANECTALFSDLEGQTVLVPVYDGGNDINGANGEFHIYAFAAFVVTGWKLTGGGPGVFNNPDPLAPACVGACRGLQGYFTEWVDLGADWEVGGPDLGVDVVRLKITDSQLADLLN